jgi:hypothetical protein
MKEQSGWKNSNIFGSRTCHDVLLGVLRPARSLLSLSPRLLLVSFGFGSLVDMLVCLFLPLVFVCLPYTHTHDRQKQWASKARLPFVPRTPSPHAHRALSFLPDGGPGNSLTLASAWPRFSSAGPSDASPARHTIPPTSHTACPCRRQATDASTISHSRLLSPPSPRCDSPPYKPQQTHHHPPPPKPASKNVPGQVLRDPVPAPPGHRHRRQGTCSHS